MQVSTSISSPACLCPLDFVTLSRGSVGTVNSGNCLINSQTIQSGAEVSRVQRRSCSVQSKSVPTAETTGGYSTERTLGLHCEQSMVGVDVQSEVLPLSEAAVSKDLDTRLNLLNGSLLFALEAVDINTQPYAIFSGMANRSWRGRSYLVLVNDEVRAARGNCACGVLCIIDACRAANIDQFCNRRAVLKRNGTCLLLYRGEKEQTDCV